MNVDIHFLERRFDEQQRGWIDSVGKDCTITFGQGATNQTVAHKAAIHKQVLRIARGAPVARRGNETADARNRRVSSINFEQIIEKLSAKNLVRSLAQVFSRRHLQDLAAIVHECKSDLGMGQRIVSYQIV